MKPRTRQFTPRAIEVDKNSIPRNMNWEEFQILDQSGKQANRWFIDILKNEELLEPNFFYKIHTQQIIAGPKDLYEYLSEKNTIRAQALLGLCYKLDKRNQGNKTYFAILKEKHENKLLIEMQIRDKITIQYFPHGRNFLDKSNDGMNLLLRVL